MEVFKKCPVCHGSVHVVQKKIAMDMPNPGQLIIEARCGECKSCGEEFFDEKMAKKFGKAADSAIKKASKEKPIKVHTGSIIV